MEKAKTGAIVLAVAAVFILSSVVTKAWMGESEKGASVGIGLWSAEVCFGGECKGESLSLDDAEGGKDKAWVIVGKLGFLLGLAGVGLFGFLAFCGFTGKTDQAAKLGMPGLGVGVAFAVLGLLFILLKPDAFDEVGVSWGFFVGILGGIGGAVGSKMVGGES